MVAMRISKNARWATVALVCMTAAQISLGQGFFERTFSHPKQAPAAQTFAAPQATATPPSSAAAPAQQTAPATQTAPASGAQSPANPASSQDQLQPREGPPANPSNITVYSRIVDLIFTVTDRKGNFVPGLEQQNFGLLDDGRPPQRVLSFKRQTNLPLRVRCV